MSSIVKNKQYYKFSFYGFLKNLRFFDAFFILFLVEKGLTFTEIGTLYAVREICINLFEIPSGIVADTFGRKKSLIGSFIFYILSFILFYISAGFWLFFTAFVFYGIADAFRTGTHKGIIIDYLKLNGWEKQKISYYGHTRSWSQKGSAISSLIAGIIVFYSGSYQNIFLYSIIPYLLNLFLIMSYPKQLNYSAKAINNKSITGLLETSKSLVIMIKKAEVFRIINTAALHTAFLKAVKDYIQPLMVSVAFLIPFLIDEKPEKRNGLVIGIIYFFIFLFSSFASKYASKMGSWKNINIQFVTLLFGFFLGILTGIFYLKEFWIISLVAFIGIYLVENVRKPILTGYISDNVPNEILTSVISAQSLLKTIFTAILAVLFGMFADRFGIGFSFLLISFTLILFSALIYYFNQFQKKNDE